MPISEDEFEAQRGQHGLSKAEQRRSNKPIMEKRRRARINHCLNELKTLILDAMKKDPARHSKLEKADILEMTVRHLQSVQRQQLAVAVATDPAVLSKFRTGFSECAGEVGRYLGRLSGVEPAVRQRLSGHLSQCVASLQQLDPNNNPGLAGVGVGSASTTTAPTGLALVPHRLPTGELALVLPHGLLPFSTASSTPQHSVTTAASTTSTTTAEAANSTAVTSGVAATPSSAVDRSHPSAFTAVNPRPTVRAPPSPLPSPTSTISDDDSLITEPYPPPPSPPTVPSSGRNVDPRSQENWFKVPTFRLFPLTGSEAPLPPPSSEDKPQQQPQVTSSTSESGLGSRPVCTSSSHQHHNTPIEISAVAELKVEFKTVPVISTVTYPSRAEGGSSVPTDQPLSIITNQEDNSTFPSAKCSPHVKTAPSCFTSKDPLDFSLRRDDFLQLSQSSVSPSPVVGVKRPLEATEATESAVSSLLTLPPPSKVPRLSFQLEIPSDSDQITSSCQQIPTTQQENNTVGTSGSAAERASTSSSSKDMWRPW